jgi:hypothetical protein
MPLSSDEKKLVDDGWDDVPCIRCGNEHSLADCKNAKPMEANGRVWQTYFSDSIKRAQANSYVNKLRKERAKQPEMGSSAAAGQAHDTTKDGQSKDTEAQATSAGPSGPSDDTQPTAAIIDFYDSNGALEVVDLSSGPIPSFNLPPD